MIDLANGPRLRTWAGAPGPSHPPDLFYPIENAPTEQRQST
ncbi:hypothetical protein [Humibacillus sp. DSM 29435]|nr:hypothetical protein [Humibacillus sp. DSM 29435]